MNDLQQRFNVALKKIAKTYFLDLKKIAVAVSGGADSLALLLLLHDFAKHNSLRIVALTVNHHLRTEAGEEAQYVASLAKKYGIEHHTLDWNHGSLSSGIEEKARQARYDLLFDWCNTNGFDILMTAHHLRDQAETFLMRLQRGSGIDGLSAMSVVSNRNNIKVVRPLLDFEPQELRDWLQGLQIEWKEDASNQCDDFLRVRVRKMLPVLERELGLTSAKIAAAASAIGDVRGYLNEQMSAFIQNNCRSWYNCAWSFSPHKFLSLHSELQFRIVAELIKLVSKKDYAPEYQSLVRACEAIADKNFSGCTLGDCEIICFQNKIWIIPESKSDKILTKEQWCDFTRRNPNVLKNGLPYKLKLYLIGKNSKAVELEE